MPALLRRSYFHAFVGTDVARSSDYENIRLNPGSVYDQPPIVTKMGKIHDIAKKARTFVRCLRPSPPLADRLFRPS